MFFKILVHLVNLDPKNPKLCFCEVSVYVSLYYPFLDSRSFVSFAIQKIQHTLSRSHQSQSPLKAANLDNTSNDNSPGRNQVERQTAVKVGCDTIQAWYIIMHVVLRADCIIVAPVGSFVLVDVKIYCLVTDVYFEKGIRITWKNWKKTHFHWYPSQMT